MGQFVCLRWPTHHTMMPLLQGVHVKAQAVQEAVALLAAAHQQAVADREAALRAREEALAERVGACGRVDPVGGAARPAWHALDEVPAHISLLTDRRLCRRLLSRPSMSLLRPWLRRSWVCRQQQVRPALHKQPCQHSICTRGKAVNVETGAEHRFVSPRQCTLFFLLTCTDAASTAAGTASAARDFQDSQQLQGSLTAELRGSPTFVTQAAGAEGPEGTALMRLSLGTDVAGRGEEITKAARLIREEVR
jgi:hypothetical protein